MKTSELTGMALDWVVTLIEKPEACAYGVTDWREQRTRAVKDGEYLYRWHQSWAQGGPIVEREVICLTHPKYDCWTAIGQDSTDLDAPLYQEDGPTPLIAAMRCFVSSHLGDDVEIPKELT